MDLDERFTTNSASKIELARAVAALVTDNDTIMLNAGTTLLYVLRAIQSKNNISIVTNSIQNAIEAISYESFNVTHSINWISTTRQNVFCRWTA